MVPTKLVLSALGAMTALALASAAQARTVFTVNSTVNENVPNNGRCTFQEALDAANRNIRSVDCQNKTGSVGEDEIDLPSGTYTVSSTLTIADDLTLYVPSGRAVFNLPAFANGFEVASDKYFDLFNSTLQNGGGQAILGRTNSFIYVDNVTITNQKFQVGSGQSGGLVQSSGGGFFAWQCSFTNNRSIKGPGLFLLSGAAGTVEECSFSGNSAEHFGGAIHNQGIFSCINSTLSGNSATVNSFSDGGAFSNSGGGSAQFDSCTIARNSSNKGAILIETGTVSLKGSIVADQLKGGTCTGPLSSRGFNIVGPVTGTGCAYSGFDLINMKPTDVQLGPLQLNGGVTLNHLPARGSIAFFTGPTDGTCPFEDQRAVQRRFSSCSSGAVEIVQ